MVKLFDGLRGLLTKSATGKSITSKDIADELRGANSKAGELVTFNTALGVTTVLACTRVIAEGVADMPLHIYESDDRGGKKIAYDHPVHKVLSRNPNELQTPGEFWETLIIHAVLTGNGFALPTWSASGELMEILPLLPSEVSIRQTESWELLYDLTPGGRYVGTVRQNEIFHLRGPCWDAVRGWSIIKTARESIGLSLAMEGSQASLYLNGGRPSGILSFKESLNEDVVKSLKTAWQASFSGGNRSGVAVLDGDASFSSITMSGVDAQLLETRRHQIEETARPFKVFPIMIGHSDKAATYASAEAFFSVNLRYTLFPWMRRITQRVDKILLDKSGPLFAEYDTREFTRANQKDRAEFSSKMQHVYTTNEMRALEGLPPIEGEQYNRPLQPLNMSAGIEEDPEDDAG